MNFFLLVLVFLTLTACDQAQRSIHLGSLKGEFHIEGITQNSIKLPMQKKSHVFVQDGKSVTAELLDFGRSYCRIGIYKTEISHPQIKTKFAYFPTIKEIEQGGHPGEILIRRLDDRFLVDIRISVFLSESERHSKREFITLYANLSCKHSEKRSFTETAGMTIGDLQKVIGFVYKWDPVP